MRSFFVIASKDGRPLEQAVVERARETIRSTIRFRGHITGEDAVVAPHWCLLAFTNTPWAPMLRTERGAVAVSGYVGTAFPAAAVDAGPDLADRISGMTGRFSAAIAEPGSGRLSVGTPAARIDSVYSAEDQDHLILGTQAPVVCRLLHDGELRYSTSALYSFINTGFFGTDDTPFEGVRALPPLHTVHIDGTSITRRDRGLWELRRERTFDEHVDACAAAFVDAIAIGGGSGEPIKLGLSGGADSRLILAGLLAAGIEPECYTTARGTSNHADVWVATEIARLAGVKHEIRETPVAVQDGRDVQRVDLLARAAKTLRATDGMMFAHDAVTFRPNFTPLVSIAGLGGEMLRGGYAEKLPRADKAKADYRAHFQFAAYAQYFTPEATAAYREELDGWLATYSSHLAPPAVLDALYTYFRVGRWVAAGSGGSMTRFAPLADNRFTEAVLGVDLQPKVTHELSLRILRRLNPTLAEFPLANKHYAVTPPEERARLAERYPEAYVKPVPVAGRSVDWRAQLHPMLVEHMREYCLDSGRIDLLAGVVDPDAAAGFFASGDARNPGRRKFLFGLYSACVMLSEQWEKAGPTCRLDIPLEVPPPAPA